MKFKYTTDIPEWLGTAEQWAQKRLNALMCHYYPKGDGTQMPLPASWPEFDPYPGYQFETYPKPMQPWKEEDDAPASLTPKLQEIHNAAFDKPKRGHDPMGKFLEWNMEYCMKDTPLWWCYVDTA